MIQSLNRLFVFQRVTPTPYNSTLVGAHSMCSLSIHAHFVLVREPEKMTSGRWVFQSPPRLCPKTRFSASVLCWGGVFIHFAFKLSWIQSLMSVLIGSRTQRCTLRSSSCFFTELFKLHTTDFFPPPLYQCLLAHNAVSIRSVLSPQQNESSPSNRWAFWKMLWQLLLEMICQCCVRQLLNVYCLSCANHKCLFCIMETCLKSVNSVC